MLHTSDALASNLLPRYLRLIFAGFTNSRRADRDRTLLFDGNECQKMSSATLFRPTIICLHQEHYYSWSG